MKPFQEDQRKRSRRFRRRAGDYACETIGIAALAAVALFILWSGHAIAQQSKPRDPVALVIETDGRTTPELQPYSEIMAGERLKVPIGSSLVFIDYHSCNRVTVSGSTVNFSASGFSTPQGANLSEQRVACPQALVPDRGGQNAAMLMRGLDTLPAVAIRPTFVIISERGRSFARVTVRDALHTMVDAELRGARFDWPSSSQSLDDGGVYQLILQPVRINERPLKLSFRAVGDSPGASEAIVLIHADR